MIHLFYAPLPLSAHHNVLPSYSRGAVGSPGAEIDSQFASIDLLAHKLLQTLHSAIHINEVCVCETSWLAGTSINGNPDIDNIANVTEELVEIGIRHLEGKVANEEGLGGRIGGGAALGLGHVVDNEAAAFHDGLVLGLNGIGSLFDSLEFNISESAGMNVNSWI